MAPEVSAMDKGRDEHARYMFALVTMMIEAAHETAIRGQSARIAPQSRLQLATRLRQICGEVLTLVEAAEAVSRHFKEKK